MKKIEAWYNVFCSQAFEIDNDIEAIAAFASKASYRASILHALHENGVIVGFKDKKEEATDCRKVCESILTGFLLRAVEQHEEKQLLDIIYAAWTKVRETYHNFGITWYTYGNAQKWVAMAIKYFIVVAANKGTTFNGRVIDTTHVLCKTVFPVDSIMIKIIKKDFGIESVKPTWSKCNDKQAFIDYIEEVKRCVGDRPVLEYEIEKWEQR